LRDCALICTTSAIESIHARLHKIIKTRGHFPSDDAATKLIWLALRNITADWGRAAKEWRAAMNQFAIAYGDRLLSSALICNSPPCLCRIGSPVVESKRCSNESSERCSVGLP
jgi:hypothetical protein